MCIDCYRHLRASEDAHVKIPLTEKAPYKFWPHYGIVETDGPETTRAKLSNRCYLCSPRRHRPADRMRQPPAIDSEQRQK
jgi:hypothetical protein